MLYAIFQPYLVIYGGQFPELEEQIVPESEPTDFFFSPAQIFSTVIFIFPLAFFINEDSWDSNPSGESSKDQTIDSMHCVVFGVVKS